jgi:hypothetical protein
MFEKLTLNLNIIRKERSLIMNLIDSICKFIENTEDKSDSELNDKIERRPAKTQAKNFFPELNPREGMSLESAKFAIGRCKGNSQFEIHDIENKGRYFTARVMDSKGRQVNELLVDKLNGRVQFLR